MVFNPSYAYVDMKKCTKMEISFRDEHVKSDAADKGVLEEWVISCRVAGFEDGFVGEYFLSRVYNSDDEVFAYRLGEDSKLVVENHFGNVRFVI